LDLSHDDGSVKCVIGVTHSRLESHFASLSLMDSILVDGEISGAHPEIAPITVCGLMCVCLVKCQSNKVHCYI